MALVIKISWGYKNETEHTLWCKHNTMNLSGLLFVSLNFSSLSFSISLFTPHVKVRESKCFQNGHHITNALTMTTILIFFICKKIQNYSRKIYHKIHLYISSLFSGYSRKLINKKNEISAVFSLILTYHQLCLPLVTLKKSDYKLWYVQRYYSLYKMGGWDKITINKINCVLSNCMECWQLTR